MKQVRLRCLFFFLIPSMLCTLLTLLFWTQLKLPKHALLAKQRFVDVLSFTADEQNVDHKNLSKLVSDLKRLALELSVTRRSLVHSATHFHRVGKHVEFLSSIIKAFSGETVYHEHSSSASNSASASPPLKREVCPEKFMGKNQRYGYPFYRNGFEQVNCTEFVPINQLVTILTILPKELSPEEQYQVLQGITKHYPNINISLVSKGKLSVDVVTKLNLNLNLKSIVSKDLTPGQTWLKLLQEVNTSYVLFAPDITYFTDDVNLERLVRVLSENRDTIIAGGSHKNQRGEWNKGCLQVLFKSWTAYFVDGYYHSFSDCIVCDVLPGPFMAKTEGLKQVGIDESLPFGVLQDLFWRLKLKHPEKVVVSCPDVMFDNYEREIPEENYVALAQKWDVKKWIESNGRVRWYGCRRGHLHNKNGRCSRPKGFVVPPCDLENLADAIKIVMKECEGAGVYCELEEGTVLGAVKFNKVLPWEKDADIRFLSENYTALLSLRLRLKEAGFAVNNKSGTECCTDGRKNGGIILTFRNNWKIELVGESILESELLVANGQRPTKVMFAGQWMTAMRNPGLSARNRYGPNIYRHAQHWLDLRRGPWGRYNSGSFTKCPLPGHTACLDQFPTDGNLQFSDYPLF